MLVQIKELVDYRLLILRLVALNLKLRYRGSFFGFLWTLLNPVLLMVVMYLVFSQLGGFREKNYALFLLSGLMFFTFFSQSVTSGLTSIIGNKALIQKIYVPKMVFPVSIVTSNLTNLLFFMTAYFVFASFTEVGIPWTAVYLPGVLLMLYLLALGAALIFCTLNTFFRDFAHLTDPLLRGTFYLTPIIYPPDALGPKAEALLRFNPVFYPVVLGKKVLYYGTVPDAELWLTGYGVAIAVLLTGTVAFAWNQEKFVYYA